MRSLLTAFLFLCSVSAAMAQTCKANQYDMLNWMAPQVSTVNGHYNMVYSNSGTFYWVKSNQGYPWDVNTYDANYIYQSITEQDWNNPSTYKIFEKPLPWMPRCIDVPAVPGKIASILVEPDDSKFDIHLSCRDYTTHSLGYVVNEIWGPQNLAIGNLPAAPTLTLSYRYSCDSVYNNCKYKETFALQKGSGLVQWTYYTLQNGKYVQANQTNHGYPAAFGSVTPVHPCW